MTHILILIIYAAFISLGLPDALLGSAWPVMQVEMNAPISYAGLVSLIISGGTIVSSLFSDKMTRKFSSGTITAFSVLLTAIGLFGFSVSNSFIMLCIFAIPYGFGAGAVDATLNNYAALHYKAKHMSWLHACWGIGAALGPYVMGAYLTNNMAWNYGYLTVAILQVILTVIIFASLPLWKKRDKASDETEAKELSFKEALQIKGVKLILISFFCYIAVEATAGLWASSYLVSVHDIDENTAAFFASLFYLGITTGRILSGFIADKAGDKRLIRYGLAIVLLGAILIPINESLALAGILIVGFGCAPIYPAIIHSTPSNFGKENSGAIIGIQMACAYTGMIVAPPLFGLIAEYITITLYPYYLIVFAVLMIILIEILNRYIKKIH